jgi:hypothetical protein
MQMSLEPEARDTFFSTADSIDSMVEAISKELTSECPGTVELPVFEEEILTVRGVNTREFVRKQASRIAKAPEIEISKEPNARLQWIFSHPLPILSFPQFAEKLRDILGTSWTHLLTIVESKRWLTYPWTGDIATFDGKRKILTILPSLEGLAGWRVGSDLRKSDSTFAGAAIDLEIPWWKHNRHMFLPIDAEAFELRPGVFFLRENKSPAVAPVFLKESRDQAKLLATFMWYSQRTPSADRGGLRRELSRVVDMLLEAGAIDPDMEDLVRRALEAMKGTMHKDSTICLRENESGRRRKKK